MLRKLVERPCVRILGVKRACTGYVIISSSVRPRFRRWRSIVVINHRGICCDVVTICLRIASRRCTQSVTCCASTITVVALSHPRCAPCGFRLVEGPGSSWSGIASTPTWLLSSGRRLHTGPRGALTVASTRGIPTANSTWKLRAAEHQSTYSTTCALRRAAIARPVRASANYFCRRSC